MEATIVAFVGLFLLNLIAFSIIFELYSKIDRIYDLVGIRHKDWVPAGESELWEYSSELMKLVAKKDKEYFEFFSDLRKKDNQIINENTEKSDNKLAKLEKGLAHAFKNIKALENHMGIKMVEVKEYRKMKN